MLSSTVLFMERKSSDFKYNTKNIKKKSITDWSQCQAPTHEEYDQRFLEDNRNWS